jgi:hypothetical protein
MHNVLWTARVLARRWVAAETPDYQREIWAEVTALPTATACAVALELYELICLMQPLGSLPRMEYLSGFIRWAGQQPAQPADAK